MSQAGRPVTSFVPMECDLCGKKMTGRAKIKFDSCGKHPEVPHFHQYHLCKNNYTSILGKTFSPALRFYCEAGADFWGGLATPQQETPKDALKVPDDVLSHIKDESGNTL